MTCMDLFQRVILSGVVFQRLLQYKDGVFFFGVGHLFSEIYDVCAYLLLVFVCFLRVFICVVIVCSCVYLDVVCLSVGHMLLVKTLRWSLFPSK